MGKQLMNIKNRSQLTGKTHIRTMFVDPEDLKKWQQGMLIQDALPYLAKENREFLISGITPYEWEKYFGKPEED